MGLADGISVLLSIGDDGNGVERAFSSFANQTLDHSRYEIICCLTCDDEPTGDFEKFRSRHPGTDLVVVQAPGAGAGRALNLGLAAASFGFFTVVDARDRISAPYLEELAKRCYSDTIVMAHICDVTGRRFDTPLENALVPFAGRRTVTPAAVPVMSTNAAKAASTALAREVSYDERLRDGLGTDFWARFLSGHRLAVSVVPLRAGAVYYQQASALPPSVGAAAACATDRLDVADRVATMAGHETDTRLESSLTRLAREQFDHLGRAVSEQPKLYEAVAERVRASADADQVAAFNHAAARTLAVCYVATPYNDASAIVAAKRLAWRGEPFDLICHNMAPNRTADPSTAMIDAHVRGASVEVPGEPRSERWQAQADFCERGAEAWLRLRTGLPPYERLYSRAQWAMSHGLAALVKVRQPGIRWTAEFSDPMTIDSTGAKRTAEIGRFPARVEIDRALRHAGFRLPDDVLFREWIQAIAFALADEVVFMNDNQMAFMLSGVLDPALVERVKERAVVSPHPSVPPHVLDSLPLTPKATDGRVHIGHFGRFYEHRSVGDVLDGLATLEPSERDRVMVHLFVAPDQLPEAQRQVARSGVQGSVGVAPQMGYGDFLSVSRSMDCLLVVDSAVTPTHGTNPYLPSKYADYTSVGARIWGIVEPGSPLSAAHLDVSSQYGDSTDITQGLRTILKWRQ